MKRLRWLALSIVMVLLAATAVGITGCKTVRAQQQQQVDDNVEPEPDPGRDKPGPKPPS